MATAAGKLPTEKTAALLRKAAPYNPRTISATDLAALAQSMQTFGVVQPIVVNRTTGLIVGGHQRVLAAQEAGIKELPVVYVRLDREKERALNLALNRIQGAWDNTKLSALLADLDEDVRRMTGFGEIEIADLLADAQATRGPDEITAARGNGEPAEQSALTYTLAFDTPGDMDEFYAAVRAMRLAYPGQETIATRLLAHLRAFPVPGA